MEAELSGEMEEVAADHVRARLLLHWVNSLPLTKCLLVEDLRDLRFGDVLLEIVDLLQRRGTDRGMVNSQWGLLDAETRTKYGSDAAVERVRRVVAFVAQACRSQDGDAMYIVNDANCAARVAAGEREATCAVLAILKRLSVALFSRRATLKDDSRVLQRRREQEALIERALQQSQPESKAPQPPHCKNSNTTAAQILGIPSSRAPQEAHARSPPAPSQPPTNKERAVAVAKAREQRRSKTRPLPGRNKTVTGSLRPTQNRIVAAKREEELGEGFHDSKGLHVFGMLDPIAKLKLGASEHRENGRANHGNDSEDRREAAAARAVRVCTWIQQNLQVNLPLDQLFVQHSDALVPRGPGKVRQAFGNGVLLCRIAYVLLQRYKDRIDPRDSSKLSLEDLAAVTNPQTPAQRRRNLALASSVFKACGISDEALASFDQLQHLKSFPDSVTVWRALGEVQKRVEQFEADILDEGRCEFSMKAVGGPEVDTNSQKPNESVTSPTALSPRRAPRRILSPRPTKEKSSVAYFVRNGCAPLKRAKPYITSEQMRAVNRWLESVDLDCREPAGSGVLQDPLRNGALLCAILAQEFSTSASRPLSFFKSPRTLSEMRTNLSKAFERLVDVRIPVCYLTSAAQQAVLIGDRQAEETLFEAGVPDSRSQVVETATAGSKQAQIQPSPLLLDVPAIELAEQGCSPVLKRGEARQQVGLVHSFARRLANGYGLSGDDGDDDDLFPLARPPPLGLITSGTIAPPCTPTAIGACKDSNDPLSEQDKSIEGHGARSAHARVSISMLETPSRGAVGSLARPSTPLRPTVPDITASSASEEDATKASIHPPAKLPQRREATLVQSPRVGKPPVAGKQLALSRDTITGVLTWLKRLNVRLADTAAFHDPAANLQEFQSGVLLCCIVEKVELMRSIPGVTRPSGRHQQLSRASALHNISKALAILQQKKTMPLHLLRRASAIHRGDRDVILRLLLQIRRAYGHHRLPRRPTDAPRAA